MSLNLAEGYIDDENVWNDWAIIREVVSNAIDADPFWQIQWNKERGEVIVKNKGSLNIDALHLGGGMKKSEDKIGTFREGLKMAALVAKRNGYDINIRTGNYLISFGFEKVYENTERENYPGLNDEEFEYFKNQKLLFAYIEDDKVFKNETTVIISGWYSPNIYTERFIGGGEDGGIVELFTSGTESILPVSALYNKNVWVQELPNYAFGYNLNVRMNRDRSVVSTWDINSKAAQLWANVDNISLWRMLIRAIEDKKGESNFYMGDLIRKESVKYAVKNAYESLYKNRPVAREGTIIDINSIYNDSEAPVFFSENWYNILVHCGVQSHYMSALNKLEDMKKSEKEDVLGITADHKKHLQRVQAKLKAFWKDKRNVKLEFALLDKHEYSKSEVYLDYNGIENALIKISIDAKDDIKQIWRAVFSEAIKIDQHYFGVEEAIAFLVDWTLK